jgi:hypothetical protein
MRKTLYVNQSHYQWKLGNHHSFIKQKRFLDLV